MRTLIIALAVWLCPLSLFAFTSPINDSRGQNPTNTELIEYLSVVFGEDMPHFYAILKCESGLRHWKSDGTVVKSPTKDFGISQIHLPLWLEKSKELGYDIIGSWKDNILMSRYIFERQSYKAWVCSRVMEPVFALQN